MNGWGLPTRKIVPCLLTLAIAISGFAGHSAAQQKNATPKSKDNGQQKQQKKDGEKPKAGKPKSSKQSDAPPVPKLPKSKKAKEGDAKQKISVTALSPISKELKTVILGKKAPKLDDLRGIQNRVNQLVQKLRPSVVGIRSGGGQGTGVIVTGDGMVLTAAHVIGKRGQRATVIMPDGKQHRAIAIGVDSRADSGMLKILDKGSYPYVEIGESSPLGEGQWVMALGHPGGFDPKRSSVVRVGRMLVKPGKTTLQTDCTLVGGDSGGPLFDMDGLLIGIHSRISRRIQQNYHVSIDYFTDTWDKMAKELKPHLGFSLKKGELTVSKVRAPASTGKMKVGDLIVKIHDQEIKSRDDIKKVMKSLKFDQRIKVVVKRDKKDVTLKFRVGGK